jgi:hypothetical protein
MLQKDKLMIRKKGGSNEEIRGLKGEQEIKMMKGREGKVEEKKKTKTFILIPFSFMQFQKITIPPSIDFLLMSWGLKQQ